LDSIKEKESKQMPIISIMIRIIDFIEQFDPDKVKKAKTKRKLWDKNKKSL
jgi:hypothetical protein